MHRFFDRLKSSVTILLLLFCITKPIFGDNLAYVVNRLDGTVSVIDLTTNTVIDTVTVGPTPRGLAITPNGELVFVSNPTQADISEITVATNTATTIPIGDTPFGIAVTPDGAFAYVVNNTLNQVSKLDLATDMIVATIPVGTNPFNIAITPDGAFAYVTNGFANPSTVSVIDLSTDTLIDTVTVQRNAYGVITSLDGAYVFVTNGGTPSVSVIDTSTNLVVATVSVGLEPRGLDISPDGALVYVANVAGPSISVIDAVTHVLTDTIPLIENPFDIAITPDGAFAYITNTANGVNSVSILDLSNNVVDPVTIPVGSQPQEIAITPPSPDPPIPPIPPTPLPTLDVIGSCKKDIFLTETDLYNLLEWSAPSDGAIPVRYQVFRDSVLIATIPQGSARNFEDHNRKKDTSYSYLITAENETEIIATGMITIECTR